MLSLFEWSGPDGDFFKHLCDDDVVSAYYKIDNIEDKRLYTFEKHMTMVC